MLKIAPINIAIVSGNALLKLRRHVVANMYEHKYQYFGYKSDALTAPCVLIGLHVQVRCADCSVYATCNNCSRCISVTNARLLNR